MGALNDMNTQGDAQAQASAGAQVPSGASAGATVLASAGATVLAGTNLMPAITWHRLNMNDAEVELPQGLTFASAAEVSAEGIALGEAAAAASLGESGAFEAALAAAQKAYAARADKPADTRAILEAVEADVDPHNLDVPALSAYERRAVLAEIADDLEASFETGLGAQASAWLAAAAGQEGTQVFTPAAGATGKASVRIVGTDGAANVADISVVAAENAQFTLNIEYDSPSGAAQAGVVGARLRVFAAAGATVNVNVVQTLDDGWLALDDSGYVLMDGARINVTHRMLGAGRTYTGLACDLRGEAARADISTRYLGHGAEVLDFNYVVRHHGKKTLCNIDANGVLLGESKKVLRGTIDLVHGCKGSEGTERETVLLADERVDNKTIPIILCDEDDVAGNHGATIGHVRPEQLFYLGCRGLSQEAAEGLFATATLEEVAINTESENVRAGVTRLAHKLGVQFQEVD